jgi:hypothetical protein
LNQTKKSFPFWWLMKLTFRERKGHDDNDETELARHCLSSHYWNLPERIAAHCQCFVKADVIEFECVPEFTRKPIPDSKLTFNQIVSRMGQSSYWFRLKWMTGLTMRKDRFKRQDITDTA